MSSEPPVGSRNDACIARRGSDTGGMHMKRRALFSFIAPAFAAIVAFGSSALAGEKITLDQVPAEVRTTIEKEVQKGKLGKIERESKHDRTIYEVEYTASDGKAYEIKVGEDGKLLSKKEEAKEEK